MTNDVWNWRRQARTVAHGLMALLCCAATVQPEDKPPEKPAILMSLPLGVPPGDAPRLVFRGLRLDGATEVKCGTEKIQVKLVNSAKTPVPANQAAPRVGDTQVEIEIRDLAELPEVLSFVVATPAGESAPYRVPVHPAAESGGAESPRGSVVLEVEPNAGFRQAQKIAVPQVVLGSISNPQDVDVYEFVLEREQPLTCEVFAERLGSGLDALLTLYSGEGAVIATSDDLADSRDARIALAKVGPGRWLLVVQDANDQGGPAHPYRLVVRAE